MLFHLQAQVAGRNKTAMNLSSPAEEYFQRGVLEVYKSDGIARSVMEGNYSDGVCIDLAVSKAGEH